MGQGADRDTGGSGYFQYTTTWVGTVLAEDRRYLHSIHSRQRTAERHAAYLLQDRRRSTRRRPGPRGFSADRANALQKAGFVRHPELTGTDRRLTGLPKAMWQV